MKKIIYFTFMFFTLAFISSNITYAQEKAKDDVERKKSVEEQILAKEILIIENFYKTCTAGSLQNLYDCRCLSMEFLDEYKRSMGKGSYPALLSKITNKCPNKEAIAGKTYLECKAMSASRRKNFDEYCSCVSRQYTDHLVNNMTNDLYRLSKIKKIYYRKCNSEVKESNLIKEARKNRKAISDFNYFPKIDEEKASRIEE